MRTIIKRDPSAGRRKGLIIGGLTSLAGIAAVAVFRRKRTAGNAAKSPQDYSPSKGEDLARHAHA